MRETSVAASVVADMLQYLEQRGVPAAVAARESGIALSFPAGPEDRVPGSQVERLWNFAVERTGDPIIGLHMAESYSPGALDILGFDRAELQNDRRRIGSSRAVHAAAQ